MADFDAFESADQPPQNVEEDPAAAFLAREQTELAGLEDDNFGAENPPQQSDFDPFSGNQDQSGADQEIYGEENQDDDDQWNSLLKKTQKPKKTTFLRHLLAEHTLQESVDGAQTNGPSDAYAAITQVDTERQEPEVIRKWRTEQKERLEKKDAEEEKKVNEWRDMAKKELDDWYKHHSEQLEKTKDNNRAAEAAFTKERDETQPGGEWEKICRFCEFNPKNSKTTKDVSRMRSILLQLKQTPLVR